MKGRTKQIPTYTNPVRKSHNTKTGGNGYSHTTKKKNQYLTWKNNFTTPTKAEHEHSIQLSNSAST